MSCTTWTEDWGRSEYQGLYDESDMAYDDATRPYDGLLFTDWTEDSDQVTSFLPIGLCIEVEGTSGEYLLGTGGDNLVWTRM